MTWTSLILKYGKALSVDLQVGGVAEGLRVGHFPVVGVQPLLRSIESVSKNQQVVHLLVPVEMGKIYRQEPLGALFQ
jgi:hypothetical protein